MLILKLEMLVFKLEMLVLKIRNSGTEEGIFFCFLKKKK